MELVSGSESCLHLLTTIYKLSVCFVCTQLSDILKFGVDKLFADEESSKENLNFEVILGSSVDGEWQDWNTESLKETQVSERRSDPIVPQQKQLSNFVTR